MAQKQAILLTSFGTSYLESKKKTIDKLLEETAAKFSDYKVFQAWTSNTILAILKEKKRMHIPSLEEAMSDIAAERFEKLIVQPTHLIHGWENDKMIQTIQKLMPAHLKVSFGAPLLSSTQDHRDALKAVTSEFLPLPEEDALVLMGHGTSHHANSVYAALDYMLKEMGYSNIYMGTVEAYPGLDTLIQQLGKSRASRIHLAPFMLVAGDHAMHDMAGEGKDSWKSKLEACGYEVICHLKGLGEYPDIRRIYLNHLSAAAEDPLFLA